MPEVAGRESNEAYVTLATNDSYSVGALVLGQSLRHTGSTRQLVVMITNQVTSQMREQLRSTFDAIVVVDILDSRDSTNLALLNRPDLGLTFTKLHCWRLTQYTKCVFLDADTLVLQNIDELFDCEELAAAPDVGWPDCFNSGVFVYVPSQVTYSSLISFALTHGSFDGGDQGLLNQYFSDWSTQGKTRRLPFIYNTVAQAFYSYSPAFKQFGHSVKVIHFIGSVKPWNVGYNTTTRTLEGGPYQATDFLHLWWNLFLDQVHHRLSDSLRYLVNIRHDAPQYHQPPPQPPINYSMTAPYIPPSLPVFYHPVQQEAAAPERFEPVPEVPVDRYYTPLENFYAEPPMTNLEDHSHFYSAKEFHQTWTDFGAEPKPEDAAHVEEKHGETEETGVKQEEQSDSNNNTSEAVKSEPTDETISSLQTSGGHPSHDSPHHESWTPGGYPQQLLDSGHRQYDWERGQIDYMGMDSFENIQRQLDTKIIPVDKNGSAQITGSAPYTSKENNNHQGNQSPAGKSRVLQSLENQFKEGSEFRKGSTEAVSPAAPRKSVHRATVILTPKVYKEEVINRAAKSPSRPSSAKLPDPTVDVSLAAISGGAIPLSAVIGASPTSPKSAAPAAASPVATSPAAINPVSVSQPAVDSSHNVAKPNGTTSAGLKQDLPPVSQPTGALPPHLAGPAGPQGQASFGTPRAQTGDDSGYADISSGANFGVSPPPIAFSTPVKGAHLPQQPPSAAAAHMISTPGSFDPFSSQTPAGFTQPQVSVGAKASPTSPKGVADPFSAQQSFAAGQPGAGGAFDPISPKQPGGGFAVSGGITTSPLQSPSSPISPAAHAELEFDSPPHGADPHQQPKKKGENKRGKK